MVRNWTKEEDKIILEKYENGDRGKLIKLLNRTWISIQHRGRKFGIKRINTTIKGKDVKIWTDEEINYLKMNYPSTNKDVIISKLDRGWSSIQNKAYLLKIKRDVSNANSLKLIDGSHDSFYWLGFIMADGHFTKNGDYIQINLSKKDLGHLKKFAEFVEYKGGLKKPSISINYKEIKGELINLLNITNRKTYEPCNLEKLTGNNFFSFIIGFIDGDGTINKRGNLVIKCHSSWLLNLEKMFEFISGGAYYNCRINPEGLALGTLCSTKPMREIKQKIEELKLPILKRKWERVRMDKLSKKERRGQYDNECHKMFDEGLKPSDILNSTDYSSSFIYESFKRYKNGK